MDNKSIKKIVLKKEAISNLNDTQMNVIFGGERNVSGKTLNQGGCDSVIQCCTLDKDCDRLTELACYQTNNYTCISCGNTCNNVATVACACNTLVTVCFSVCNDFCLTIECPNPTANC